MSLWTDILLLGMTIGFRSSIDLFYEKSGALQACILMYNGNLERNVSITITTVASTADGELINAVYALTKDILFYIVTL